MTSLTPLKNDVFLRALRRETTPYTPVWLMRQAGRYLPEYRATRAQAGSFMQLAQNPMLATEVTLQPIDRYNLDAAILFSDILTVPDAMGLGLRFVEGEGPVFDRPLQDEVAVQRLEVPDMGRLQYVFDAVAKIRSALDGRVPLIGFAGSPYTIACYMVEGGSSREFKTIKSMMYRRPDLLHHILMVNARATVEYLNAQIAAGAQAVMLFDTWGGSLAHHAYQEFSLAYMRQVIQGLTREVNGEKIPVIMFTKGGGIWLDSMAESGADALGLDWTVDVGVARAQVGHRVALQGNIDPMILFGSDEAIRKEVRRVLDAFGPNAGHVFNLGHGISQFTSPEAVKVLVDEVHSYSRQIRKSSDL
ncbi:uroporphyrinogen decarboxylase [Hydromonas duriensis]|uniref:Uroporphyrinogen decarboxylase n=1 Tax=Hydromonas duriensis TaxID=1527608 RepID=A0A4R6Y5X1_9BURK|nr:uroporphyrinogen decarboxylase [Hydromonas duriensis]TDR30921.1 uroporphyrinogen decarboxylase [Hydromonas duriensis]